MVNDDNHSKIEDTIETARHLAINGEYDKAIRLLYPLIDSPYSIEVLILLGKIFAQNMDFDSAEVCFKNVLELDENNIEAKEALNKCYELKNSKFKTLMSYGSRTYLVSLIFFIIIIILDSIFLIYLFMKFIK